MTPKSHDQEALHTHKQRQYFDKATTMAMPVRDSGPDGGDNNDAVPALFHKHMTRSLPLDLMARNRNRNRSPSEERTVALVVITLVVILAVPITALPIAISTAVVIAAATAMVIPTGAMISSVTTLVSFTRLGRSNSDYC